nr:YraN family protein [Azoarcus olearius]
MQARGREGEERAAAHLAAQGVRILARNRHCRGGELDLVGLHGDMLVFVEVRMRANPRFGGAAASITAEKRRRVILAAQWWLAGEGRRHAHRPCRFDVVLLEGPATTPPTWLQAAFDAD